MKTVAISVRLGEEDALFLANYSAQGAVTMSDKIRSVLGQAKLDYQAANSERTWQWLQKEMAPIEKSIQLWETQTGRHSELPIQVIQWLASTLCFVVDEGEKMQSDLNSASPITLEKGLAQRAVRLCENMLRLGVTQNSPCYDSLILDQGLDPVLQLASLITNRRSENNE